MTDMEGMIPDQARNGGSKRVQNALTVARGERSECCGARPVCRLSVLTKKESGNPSHPLSWGGRKVCRSPHVDDLRILAIFV
jgi:hypothetical protein